MISQNSRRFIKSSLTTALILSLFAVAGCELPDESDESSEGEVEVRAIDISCLVLDAVGCSSGNDGGTLVVGLVDDCDSFSSSSQFYAQATGVLECDVVGCELSSAIQPSSFSPSTVEPDTYDLYAFIDEDEDGEPDTLTEPIGCYTDVVIDGSSTQITISDWE